MTYRFLLPLALIGAFLHSALLQAQNRDEWSAFSALNATQAVAFDSSGTVWVATTGGVFAYHRGQDSFEIFRTTEGLIALNATAIAVDQSTGNLYVGGDDGSVSIRKPSGDWSYSMDLVTQTQHPDKRITGFGFHNGKAYILTNFGGAVFNPADSTILDNFSNLNTGANAIVFWRGRIWLGTGRGLASTDESNPTLANPISWRFVSGSDSMAVLSLAVVRDTLILGTDKGGFQLVGDDSLSQLAAFPVAPTYLSGNETTLGVGFGRTFIGMRQGAIVDNVATPDGITSVAVSQSGETVIGLRNQGIALLKRLDGGDTLVTRVPNAPASNIFTEVALAADGSLWTANRGSGVSRFKTGEWTQYNQSNTGIAGFDDAWNISPGANGTIWAGSFGGGGATRFRTVDTGIEIIHYDAFNSPLNQAVAGVDAKNFVIAGEAAGDLNGRTWLVNWGQSGTIGPTLLVQLRPDEGEGEKGGFYSFFTPNNRKYRWLAIDGNGTKWLGADFGLGDLNGLFYYNDRGTVADKSDDIWGNLKQDNGLPDNNITAIKIDPDGIVWIGTTSGLTTLLNPMSVVINSQPPDFQSIKLLSNIRISSIAIDVLNRKWIGTSDQGVFLLSPDGTRLLEHYTISNSPLVNNQIYSILAVDTTGDVYIGTANGMSRISTVAVESPDTGGQITVAPQPFRLPSAEPLRIAGLPGNATVKILTLTGGLVRQIPSPGGGVAFWDGTDEQGDDVPTGIYLVAAESNDGGGTALGKVAVIRH